MGASTAIEWTQSTWNPWRGCAKVSPGCASCYMYRDQLRYGRDPQEVVRTKPSTFDAPLRWRNSAEASSSPLVFTCSWSDWFHPSADPWRDDAWSIVKQCPTLTFQILTKRPELIRERLPADWGPDGYPNVWLGVSIENHRFTWRAEELLEVPARIRFVSAEPLLGKIDLSPFLALDRINWVIVGGESGGRRGHPPRRMKPEWATAIREQCEEAGVDFFFKQWGGRLPGGPALLDGREWRQTPAHPAYRVERPLSEFGAR